MSKIKAVRYECHLCNVPSDPCIITIENFDEDNTKEPTSCLWNHTAEYGRAEWIRVIPDLEQIEEP